MGKRLSNDKLLDRIDRLIDRHGTAGILRIIRESYERAIERGNTRKHTAQTYQQFIDVMDQAYGAIVDAGIPREEEEDDE